MSNAYESTFIVDAHLSTENIESSIKKYSKIIEDNGGVIKLIDRWGKRRLTYEIAKKQYGYYVYIRFDADGTLIKPLEREYKLDDNVIRYLTVTVPKAVVANESEMDSKTEEAESDAAAGKDTESDSKGADAVSTDESKESVPAEDTKDDKEEPKESVPAEDAEGDKEEANQEA
ncbi:30S ribosomal protein S6 [bacterium]